MKNVLIASVVTLSTLFTQTAFAQEDLVNQDGINRDHVAGFKRVITNDTLNRKNDMNDFYHFMLDERQLEAKVNRLRELSSDLYARVQAEQGDTLNELMETINDNCSFTEDAGKDIIHGGGLEKNPDTMCAASYAMTVYGNGTVVKLPLVDRWLVNYEIRKDIEVGFTADFTEDVNNVFVSFDLRSAKQLGDGKVFENDFKNLVLMWGNASMNLLHASILLNGGIIKGENLDYIINSGYAPYQPYFRDIAELLTLRNEIASHMSLKDKGWQWVQKVTAEGVDLDMGHTDHELNEVGYHIMQCMPRIRPLDDWFEFCV